jgi:pimeloyl-ACP methyl ester carboxylesterase
VSAFRLKLRSDLHSYRPRKIRCVRLSNPFKSSSLIGIRIDIMASNAILELRSRRLSWLLSMLIALPAASQNPDQPKSTCKPPGRLVDLGGFRLHLFCTGQPSGSPTVLLLHGLGDSSLDWGLVQPEVAPFARVCSYDRAGAGWSDPGPSPRGPLTAAKELHSLLINAKVTGPYVLVAHSWGGLIARVYASQFPTEVAGMVLVDPTHEDAYFEINGQIVVPRLVSDTEWATIKPKGSSPHGERSVTKLNPPFDRLPPDEQTLRECLMSLPLSQSQIDGGDVQDMRQDLADVYALTRTKDGKYRIGDIPLIVLTRSIDGAHGPLAPEKLKYNEQMEDDLTHASSLAKHVVASTSDHHIQLTEPDLVITSIREVFATAVQIDSPLLFVDNADLRDHPLSRSVAAGSPVGRRCLTPEGRRTQP